MSGLAGDSTLNMFKLSSSISLMEKVSTTLKIKVLSSITSLTAVLLLSPDYLHVESQRIYGTADCYAWRYITPWQPSREE